MSDAQRRPPALSTVSFVIQPRKVTAVTDRAVDTAQRERPDKVHVRSLRNAWRYHGDNNNNNDI